MLIYFSFKIFYCRVSVLWLIYFTSGFSSLWILLPGFSGLWILLPGFSLTFYIYSFPLKRKKMIKINISETPRKRQKSFRNLIPLVSLTLANWCILGTLKYCFIIVEWILRYCTWLQIRCSTVKKFKYR